MRGYFVYQNSSALWMLGILSVPISSLLSPVMSWFHALFGRNPDINVAVDFVLLLVAGALRCGAFGYVVGKAIVAARPSAIRDGHGGR